MQIFPSYCLAATSPLPLNVGYLLKVTPAPCSHRCSTYHPSCWGLSDLGREKLYTDSKNKTRSWLWLRSWTPYCQIWLKLKKIGKTTRPFRYDLNQIPYNYTVEMTNKFKGLDLIDGVPEELWTEVHDIVQEAVINTIPKKKKCKNAKWLSEQALQIVVKRREVKSKG